MNKLDDAFFQDPVASTLTSLRIKARRKRRITYDCLNTIVKGAMVLCKEGHHFWRVGQQKREGFPLLGVLKGRSSSVCQNCEDYDGERHE